jgi:hypothetical protein
MLSPQREKFVANLVSGMSQRQAYKDAFGANYDDNAIDNKASKLFNRKEVKARYKELLGELNEKNKDKAIMSAQERMAWLTDIINGKIGDDIVLDGKKITKSADLNTRMKALDILNKMSGEYIEKLKIGNESEDKPFEVNIKVVK